MTLILELLGQFWPYVVGGATAFIGLAGAYFTVKHKGVAQERARAQKEDTDNAIQIRKDGADARAHADAAATGDGLRRNDGWKREP